MTSLSAGGLANTEVFTSMTPYVLLAGSGYSFRTPLALGRNSLSWQVHLLLPMACPLVVEVKDKDMMFDDDVGKVRIPQLEEGAKEYQLEVGGGKRKEGRIRIETKQVKSKPTGEPINPPNKRAGNKVLCLSVQTLQLADPKFRGDVFFRLIDREIEKVCMPVSRQGGAVFFWEEVALASSSPSWTVQIVTTRSAGTEDVVLA